VSSGSRAPAERQPLMQQGRPVRSALFARCSGPSLAPPGLPLALCGAAAHLNVPQVPTSVCDPQVAKQSFDHVGALVHRPGHGSVRWQSGSGRRAHPLREASARRLLGRRRTVKGPRTQRLENRQRTPRRHLERTTGRFLDLAVGDVHHFYPLSPLTLSTDNCWRIVGGCLAACEPPPCDPGRHPNSACGVLLVMLAGLLQAKVLSATAVQMR